MEKITNISLGTHFEEFINQKIQSGTYSSINEVILSALSLLENEDKKEKALIVELEKGEESGFVDNFDPKQNLEMLHRNHL